MRASAYDETRYSEMMVFRAQRSGGVWGKQYLYVDGRRHPFGHHQLSGQAARRQGCRRSTGGGATTVSVPGSCSELQTQQRVPRSDQQTFGGDWACCLH